MIKIPITFCKKQDQLDLIRKRAVFYNKIIKRYTGGYSGRIPVPVDDKKKLKGKFSTVEEYIKSDKRWIKLKEFDDTNYSFESYIETMIQSWDLVKIMLNNEKLTTVPMFHIIMSPKMGGIYWEITKKNIKNKQTNLYKVKKDATNIFTYDSDLFFLKDNLERNPEMTINDILFTFRRDFSQRFIIEVENLLKKGSKIDEIIKVFEGDQNK